jgi:hypothetical protein
MNASRMMTRITTTNQKKNTTIAGIAYPPTVLALATPHSYPAPPGLSATGVIAEPRISEWLSRNGHSGRETEVVPRGVRRGA